MRDAYMRGALSRPATPRQLNVLAAYVAAGGSVADAADLVGLRPSTVKRHLADLRARSGLTTEQLIYAGRAGGWLVVPSLDPSWASPPQPQAPPPRRPRLRLPQPVANHPDEALGPAAGNSGPRTTRRLPARQPRLRRPAMTRATRIGTPTRMRGRPNPTPSASATGAVARPILAAHRRPRQSPRPATTSTAQTPTHAQPRT